MNKIYIIRNIVKSLNIVSSEILLISKNHFIMNEHNKIYFTFVKTSSTRVE